MTPIFSGVWRIRVCGLPWEVREKRRYAGRERRVEAEHLRKQRREEGFFRGDQRLFGADFEPKKERAGGGWTR